MMKEANNQKMNPMIATSNNPMPILCKINQSIFWRKKLKKLSLRKKIGSKVLKLTAMMTTMKSHKRKSR